jgi:hypothetical protein
LLSEALARSDRATAFSIAASGLFFEESGSRFNLERIALEWILENRFSFDRYILSRALSAQLCAEHMNYSKRLIDELEVHHGDVFDGIAALRARHEEEHRRWRRSADGGLNALEQVLTTIEQLLEEKCRNDGNALTSFASMIENRLQKLTSENYLSAREVRTHMAQGLLDAKRAIVEEVARMFGQLHQEHTDYLCCAAVERCTLQENNTREIVEDSELTSRDCLNCDLQRSWWMELLRGKESDSLYLYAHALEEQLCLWQKQFFVHLCTTAEGSIEAANCTVGGSLRPLGPTAEWHHHFDIDLSNMDSNESLTCGSSRPAPTLLGMSTPRPRKQTPLRALVDGVVEHLTGSKKRHPQSYDDDDCRLQQINPVVRPLLEPMRNNAWRREFLPGSPTPRWSSFVKDPSNFSHFYS